MVAPKNYTVRQMEREPGFAADVKALMDKHPLWSRAYARRIAAQRAFARRINQPRPRNDT